MNEETLRIGEDNVCPVTHQQCDDECCSPGAQCNLGMYLPDVPGQGKTSRLVDSERGVVSEPQNNS